MLQEKDLKVGTCIAANWDKTEGIIINIDISKKYPYQILFFDTVASNPVLMVMELRFKDIQKYDLSINPHFVRMENLHQLLWYDFQLLGVYKKKDPYGYAGDNRYDFSVIYLKTRNKYIQLIVPNENLTEKIENSNNDFVYIAEADTPDEAVFIKNDEDSYFINSLSSAFFYLYNMEEIREDDIQKVTGINNLDNSGNGIIFFDNVGNPFLAIGTFNDKIMRETNGNGVFMSNDRLKRCSLDKFKNFVFEKENHQYYSVKKIQI